jgi:drug/metabolite transporter (DMT)-like permease
MLIAAMLFWAMSFIWYKQAFPAFRPVSLILFRLIISFLLLMLYFAFSNRMKWPKIKDFKFFFLLAFLEPFLYFIGECYGMQYVSSTLASILIATIPLFATVAAYYFYHEKFTINKYFGILISFTGVIFVVYFDSRIGEAPLKGIILMMIAVLSTVGYSTILKRLLVDYNAFSIVWIQNFLGILYFLPLFFIVDAHEFKWSNFSLHDFLPVINMAVFASTFGFLFFIEGVKKIGITRAVLFTNFIPILTATFAVIFLNEKMSFLKILGIFLTIAGLIMTEKTAKSAYKILKNRVRK